VPFFKPCVAAVNVPAAEFDSTGMLPFGTGKVNGVPDVTTAGLPVPWFCDVYADLQRRTRSSPKRVIGTSHGGFRQREGFGRSGLRDTGEGQGGKRLVHSGTPSFTVVRAALPSDVIGCVGD